MKVGIDDLLMTPNGAETLRRLLADGGERIQPDVWKDIKKEFTYEPIEPFPMDSMPPELKPMAEHTCRTAQVDPVVAGTLLLSSVGSAASGAYFTEAKRGIRIGSNLYVFTVLGPGERKSTSHNIVIRPHQRWISEHRATYEEHLNQTSFIEEKIALLKRDRLKSKNATEDANIARQIEELRKSIPTVYNPNFIESNVTTEAAIKRMDQTGGMLLIESGDGRMFLHIIFGRFSQTTEEALYTDAYHGDVPIRKTRVNDDNSCEIEKPRVSIMVSFQDDVLERLGTRVEFQESGFLSRVLLIVPDPRAGRRDSNGRLLREYSEDEIPEDVANCYAALITKLLDRSYDTEQPETLIPLTPPAKQIWIDFYNEIEGKLGPGQELHPIAELAKRYPDHALRLALISSVCREGTEITDEDVTRGITLVRHFYLHALRAQRVMKQNSLPEQPARIVSFLRRHRRKRFTLAELSRSVGSFSSTEQRDTAVAWLAENHFCRPVEDAGKSGPGRSPSPAYEVNPHIHNGEIT